jgi:ATP phosphoribosyltransferase regulatory subunit
LLDDLEERHALISQQAPEFLEGAMFSPAFGRRFTYYDGFVFEIGELGERRSSPFGAGGRYDALLTDLSHGSVSATAIGGVVRPDRLALARANGATT